MSTEQEFAEAFVEQVEAEEGLPVEEEQGEEDLLAEDEEVEEEAEDAEEEGEAEEPVEAAEEQPADEDDPYADIDDYVPPTAPQPDADLQAHIEELRARNEVLSQQILTAENIKLPDNDLRDPDSPNYNPDEYNRQALDYEKKVEAFHERRQEAERARAEEQGRFIQARDAELQKDLPVLFDKDRGPKVITAMAKVAAEAGLTQDQFQTLPAGAVKLLDEVLRFRSAQHKLEKAKTAKKASKVVGRSTRKAPSRRQNAENRLAQTGRVEDFASIFTDE